MKTRAIFILGSALLLAAGAAGQAGQFRMNYGPPYAMPALTGLPYSAEQVSENVQTLADGTHITQPQMSVKMFRDAAGRTRTERAVVPFPGRPDVPAIPEIYDVVAGFRYILDPVNKVAHRSAIPPAPQRGNTVSGQVGSGVTGAITIQSSTTTAAAARPAPPKAADVPPRPETSSESLGTQVIDGLNCEGRLMKMTYPAGAMGNDRPLVTTTEMWTSTDLKVVVLNKRKDPRMGESTMQLKNVSRAEPEFSLFQPPPDYKVVDETGSFEITIKY